MDVNEQTAAEIKPGTAASSSSKKISQGAAWVKGGKIYVLDPAEEGKKATITPCPEVKILVNDKPVAGKTEVSQHDKIEAIPISHQDPGYVKVHISPDKMSAFLEIKTECHNTYELVDCPPANHLTLKAAPKKQIIFKETRESLLNLLNQHKVTYGIDQGAIDSILKEPKDGMMPVAQGMPPGQSTDDIVELLFEHNATHYENIKGTIDFKEMSNIPSVSMGDTLARKMLGLEGSPGLTVTNQVCKAKEPKRINLLAGPGVEIVEDGLKAIATREGQPKVQKSGNGWFFSVEPVLTIPGDVNVKTGNVRFKGDVNIMGSVDNDMSVSATGNITVQNIITKCKITAGGDVNIKGNIVNAEVVSGGFSVLCNNLKPLLQDLLRNLEDLYISANLMIEKLPPKTKVIFGNILVLLIEKKFMHLNNLLDKLNKKVKEMDLKLLGSYEQVLQRTINSLSGINILQYQTQGDFQKTLTDLNNFFYYVDSLVNKRSMVSIKVALNSVIKSSGDVSVSQGCFNTHIIAEGSVKIDGIFRGGIIKAADDVYIKEIGSQMGAKSQVAVAADKKIKIDHAFEGVSVQIGKLSKTLDKEMFNIIVALDDEGNLQIKNF
ncbi:FapA family protein [Desulfotomaculum varum]